MSHKNALGSVLASICALLVAGMYWVSLPLYVQGGDTAELVVAANALTVPHPPGFPLWIWLQWAWTHCIAGPSLFWKAASFNALAATASLLLLVRQTKVPALWRILGILILGMSAAFSEAAVLPDVFALHALLTLAIGTLYLFGDVTSIQRTAGVPFLCAMGAANHPTIVMMGPIFLAVLVESVQHEGGLKQFCWGAALGALGMIGLYLTLPLMHPEDVKSWGEVTDLGAIIRHFLRVDYGTFKLAAAEQTSLLSLSALKYFLTSSFLEIVGLLVFALLLFYPHGYLNPRRRLWGMSASLLLSSLFLVMSQMEANGVGEEVLRRFHVMPMIQCVLLALYMGSQVTLNNKHKALGVLLIVPMLLMSAVRFSHLPELRNDSVIEDYVRNLLAVADTQKPTIILKQDDTGFFALRYVQWVSPQQYETDVVNPALLTDAWYYKKMVENIPGFTGDFSQRTTDSAKMKMFYDVIAANIPHFSFVVTENFQNSAQFHVTFMGLGRRITQGSDVEFDASSLEHLKWGTTLARQPDSPQGYTKESLYVQYSHYWLAKGVADYKHNNSDHAVADWNEALRLVPNCLPALTNLCKIKHASDPRCSPENMEAVAQDAADFF